MILRRTNLLFSILCLNSKLEKLWGHKFVPVMSQIYLTSYFCLVRFETVRFLVVPFKPHLNKNVKVIPVFLSENWLFLISNCGLIKIRKILSKTETQRYLSLCCFTVVNRLCIAWNWGSRKIAFAVHLIFKFHLRSLWFLNFICGPFDF